MAKESTGRSGRPRKQVVVNPESPPEPEPDVKYLLPGAWAASHPEEAAELIVRLLNAALRLGVATDTELGRRLTRM